MEVKEKFEFKSEVLKKARETKGYKQDELAKLIFTTRQTISNWENGKKIPTLANIDRLAQVLNVSIDDLIEREGDEEQKTNDEQLDQLDSTNYSLVYTPTIKKSIKDLKWIKIILALILIILVIYLGTSIRKFCILYDIHKKMNNYIGIDNYYLKTDYWEIDDNNIIKYDTEVWRMEDKYKELTIFQSNTIVNYIENNEMYIVNNNEKTIIKNNYFNIDNYNNQIQGKLFSNKTKDIRNILLNSFNFNFKIVDGNYYYIYYKVKSGMEHYRVEEKINKETGLIEESNIQYDNKSTIEIYVFQPNIVNENDVNMTDITNTYTIIN